MIRKVVDKIERDLTEVVMGHLRQAFRDGFKEGWEGAIDMVFWRCPGCIEGAVRRDDTWMLPRYKCKKCGRVWSVMSIPQFLKRRMEVL
ncbi:MAG: hypothetical protein PHU95_02275 [Candidatus Thermoplasmatota archaeon]|nr:hypothetical protein [Candidatus Thermoplasmatota archaeon]MDD5778258.1 hypothetical protein [Candidatus Thermoplasmatota archaeon]